MESAVVYEKPIQFRGRKKYLAGIFPVSKGGKVQRLQKSHTPVNMQHGVRGTIAHEQGAVFYRNAEGSHGAQIIR